MPSNKKHDVLLVCVTLREREALLRRFECEGRPWGRSNTYQELKEISGTSVVLLDCQMGSGTPGGALLSIRDAIEDCHPRHILMAGIAWGANPSRQTIGQVLVADKCQDYDPERLGANADGSPSHIGRGCRIPASSQIVGIFSAVAGNEHFEHEPLFGTLLSGSKLIDNAEAKAGILQQCPEAIGGDMEIAGLATAAHDAGIPWGAAKAICDFADGNKNTDKERNQRTAAAEAAGFVFSAIKSGRFALPGKCKESLFDPEKYEESGPPDRRIRELGLVDLALQRGALSWRYLSKSLDDLIDDIPVKGEYFIVARSMERWVRNREGSNHTYLGKLARRVRRDQLRCTFVLPERDLKSLVLSDPSQGVQAETWQAIETELQNAMGIDDGGGDEGDLEHGYIEIYTIPAYVPSTFSKVSGRDGVEYCSLEVGIGVPPEEDRVLLYFEKNEAQQSIYERLYSIYRGIIEEREPRYKFPQHKWRMAEDPAVLAKTYGELRNGFRRDGFHVAHCHENRDWFAKIQPVEPDGEKYHEISGTAACVANLPLQNYLGGGDVVQVARAMGEQMLGVIDPGERGKFAWVADDELLIPVFYYKSSYAGTFRSPWDDPEEERQLISCLSSHEPFGLRFRHLVIDRWGRIMLLAYPTGEGAKRLASLRSDLRVLAKGEFRRFDSRRPCDVGCVLGRINQELRNDDLRRVKEFADRHFHLGTEPEVEIDQLRLVKMEGTFSRHTIHGLGASVVLKTDLLEVGRHETYGIMARGKWLGHPDVVGMLKSGRVCEVNPVTVHLAPSLECVYGCPTCSYGCSKTHSAVPDGRRMSWSDMESSIDKLTVANVRGLIFTGGGEPLTNEHTLRGMRYARGRGLSVGLFTNGLLLDARAASYLMEVPREMPNFVRFSINAGTPDSYRLVHGCPRENFGRVLDNLAGLCRAKKELGVDMKLDIGVLITPAMVDNLADLAIEIKRLAIHYPGMLNSMLIRPAVNYRGGNQRNEYTEELLRDDGYGAKYQRFFERGKQFDAALFEDAKTKVTELVRPLLTGQSAFRVDVSFPEERLARVAGSAAERSFAKCPACNLVAFVGPDTGVYRCVEQALRPELCLGKLHDVPSLSRLWTRAGLGGKKPWSGGCPPVCLLYETNVVWHKIAEARMTSASTKSLDHQIDLAAEQFDRCVAPLIGEAVNFI